MLIKRVVLHPQASPSKLLRKESGYLPYLAPTEMESMTGFSQVQLRTVTRPSEVFIYVLEIEWNDGKVQQLTGDINLLR